MTMTLAFDRVHDIQTAYRKVLEALSRPGEIAHLDEEAQKAEGLLPGCLPSTAVLALMLLDTEVTFKVVSEREDEVIAWFNRLTSAKAADAEQADYIFVLQDARPGDFEQVLLAAKSGTLEDPHQSATLIVEAASVTDGPALRLTGPGIAQENSARIGAPGDWIEVRARNNNEYPMGVDLLFVDANHRLIGLPRTTQISVQVDG
jgi:alpha-D-ribose 1-methylphosphonate 5-triphosphate synthase subunit PhnH